MLKHPTRDLFDQSNQKKTYSEHNSYSLQNFLPKEVGINLEFMCVLFGYADTQRLTLLSRM